MIYNKKKLTSFISDLNKDILSKSDNNFDLSNYLQEDKSLYNNEFLGYNQFENKSFYEPKIGYINDSIKERVLVTYDLLDENSEAKIELAKVLNRTILYIGSECQGQGKINIVEEFNLLKNILTNPFINIEKTKNPSIKSIFSKWSTLEPSIIIFSCHGDKTGLFLNNEKNECQHYGNLHFFKLFKMWSNYTDCVILSSCESLELGKMIRDVGKKVICINKKVNIDTTAKFNELFFDYMNNHSFRGKSDVFERAFNHTMNILEFKNIKDTFSFEFIESKNIS